MTQATSPVHGGEMGNFEPAMRQRPASQKFGWRVASSAAFVGCTAFVALSSPHAYAGTSAGANLGVPEHSLLLAKDEPSAVQEAPERTYQAPAGTLLAQADSDDAYDPFADYSEFEESMDEEEDINFFRNGRLLTVGFLVGYRGWTGTLNQAYTSNPMFGVFLSYFFDLRFAMQFSYMTSDHILRIPSDGTFDTVQGNISIQDISANLKYYFNTQNVTRGLADLNPYVIGGFSQIYRTANVVGNSQFSKDSAFAFDVGGGLELPLLHNKMYTGFQVMYQIVNFPDTGKVYLDDNGNSTHFTPSGNSWNLQAILGVNF